MRAIGWEANIIKFIKRQKFAPTRSIDAFNIKVKGISPPGSRTVPVGGRRQKKEKQGMKKPKNQKQISKAKSGNLYRHTISI